MQYLGSKNRISKYILPIILKDRKIDQFYVEPFCGGCNTIDKVTGNRIAGDSNNYLISLWIALQNGYCPPENISREYYYKIKNNKDNFAPELVAFVGFLCSFGAKWFAGYAFNKKGDNYASRGKRCLLKQIQKLKEVNFYNKSYHELDIPPNSIIYNDPPYENTTKYKDEFDHKTFWDWCRTMSISGHNVYVSEYNAPTDFICIKEIPHKTILDKNCQYTRIEKLFKYNGN